MSNHPKTRAQAADNRTFPIIVFSLAAAIALGIAMLPFAAKAAGSEEEIRAMFRRVRDEIRVKFEAYAAEIPS